MYFGTNDVFCFKNSKDWDEVWKRVKSCASKGVVRHNRVTITQKYTPPTCTLTSTFVSLVFDYNYHVIQLNEYVIIH